MDPGIYNPLLSCLLVGLGLLGLTLLTLILAAALAVFALCVAGVGALLTVATVTTTASATTTSTSATATSTTATASTSTAAATATTLVVVSALLPVVVGLDASVLDALELLIHVCLLALDAQFLALECGLGVKLEELLGGLLVCELDENASLELALLASAQAHGVEGTVDGEKLLNVGLGAGLLLAESLGVDAAGHSLVLELLAVLIGVVAEVLADGLLAGDLAVIGNVDQSAGLAGFEDGGVRLEVAHALEVVDDLEVDGVVLVATSLLKEVVVAGEVGVGEVEFDLATDTLGVAAFWELLVVGSDALGTATVVLGTAASLLALVLLGGLGCCILVSIRAMSLRMIDGRTLLGLGLGLLLRLLFLHLVLLLGLGLGHDCIFRSGGCGRELGSLIGV